MDFLKNRNPGKWLVLALSMFSVLAFVSLARMGEAESTEDVSQEVGSWMNRQPANAPAVTGNTQARKRYPGGADEDDLQVQATLPNPHRGLEAQDSPSSPSAAPTDAPAATD